MFATADYTVFCCTLAVSVCIGIFSASKNRNRKSEDGGNNMHPIPVAMSLLSSFMPVVIVFGTPTEVYTNGSMFLFVTIGFLIAAFCACHIYAPVFFNLGITSVLQYIEMRFGQVPKFISMYLLTLNMYVTMSITLYASALALTAVTGMEVWGAIIVLGAVFTLYSCIDGMKSLLWAETLQLLIMYVGMLTMLIKGSSNQGGFQNAWKIAKENGRTLLHDFETDPRLRHSTWSLVIGGGVLWCSIFGTNQVQVQRAVAAGTETRMKIGMWLNFGALAFTIIISSLVGVVMYAFYSTCDPVEFGSISQTDQLLPLFMVDLLSDSPGLSGFFLAAVFSSSLSAISTGLIAMSESSKDLLLTIKCCKGMSPTNAMWLVKSFVIMNGGFVIAIAFLPEVVGGLLLPLALTMYGSLWGPVFGLFALGMTFPWANKSGGLIGLLASIGVINLIGLGATFTKASVAPVLPINTDGCNWNVTAMSPPNPATTLPPGVTTPSIFDVPDGLENLYSVSYLWYTAICALTVVVVGLVASLITGPTDPKTINPKLIAPVFDICLPCLPDKIRKKLRFGVRHGEEVDMPNVMTSKPGQKLNSNHNSINIGHDNVGYGKADDTRL